MTTALNDIDNETALRCIDSSTTEEKKDESLAVQEQDETLPRDLLNLFDFEEIKWGRKLGSGSFAVVSAIRSIELTSKREFSDASVKARCFIRDNATRYAIKFLKPQKPPELHKRAMDDIKREASILSKISHPNIIAVHACHITEKQCFMILDRLEKDDLEDRIERWKATAQQISFDKMWYFWDFKKTRFNEATRDLLIERLNVAHGVAQALAHLHKHGIVYRDMKPGNVGFDMHGHTRLLDFGLARDLPEKLSTPQDAYKMSGRTGTIIYMAPEVWFKRPYNEKVDVYAFCHLLWEMLALEKPYEQYLGFDYDQAVLVEAVHVKGERPQIKPEWPVAVQEIFNKAWLQDYKDRPSMEQVCVLLKESMEAPGPQEGDSSDASCQPQEEFGPQESDSGDASNTSRELQVGTQSRLSDTLSLVPGLHHLVSLFSTVLMPSTLVGSESPLEPQAETTGSLSEAGPEGKLEADYGCTQTTKGSGE